MPFLIEGATQIDIANDADRQAQTAGKILDATAIIDENNMQSNSPSRLPTQSSIVAYVANQTAGGVTYRGVMPIPADMTTNATGNPYADWSNSYLVGDMFIAGSSGVLIVSDGNISVEKGEALIINTTTQDANITKAKVDGIESSSPSDKFFTGDLKHSAQTTNHGAWLLCNGAAVSRITYAKLFATIGVSFGIGDDFTTFNLPDFRGRVIGAASGVHLIGENIGSDTATLATANLPAHTHSINHDHGSFISGSGGDSFISQGEYGLIRRSPGGNNTINGISRDTTPGEPDVVTAPGAWNHTHSIDVPAFSGTSGSTGSGTAFNIMQPTLFGGNVFIFSL